LLFILSVGVKIISFFLKPFPNPDGIVDEVELLNWRKLSFFSRLKNGFLLVVGALISIGISLGISRLLTGGESPGIIILILTCLALGLSFISRVRHFEG